MAIPFEIPTTRPDAKGVEILAKSIYRELRAGGCDERDVVALASELVRLVSEEFRAAREAAAAE